MISIDNTDDNKISIAFQTLGTILILYSWYCVSYGNAIHTDAWYIVPYPYNYVAESLGTFIWACIGVYWRNKNIVIMNGVIALMSFVGLFTNVL